MFKLTAPCRPVCQASGICDVLEKTKIGYVTVSSGKGRFFTFPVIFLYDGFNIYFSTSRHSIIMRFLQENANVCFCADNGQLMHNARGIVIHGTAEIIELNETVASAPSMVRILMQLSQKYPGVVDTYAFRSGIPIERRPHNLRLIRLRLSDMFCWTGYQRNVCKVGNQHTCKFGYPKCTCPVWVRAHARLPE